MREDGQALSASGGKHPWQQSVLPCRRWCARPRCVGPPREGARGCAAFGSAFARCRQKCERQPPSARRAARPAPAEEITDGAQVLQLGAPSPAPIPRLLRWRRGGGRGKVTGRGWPVADSTSARGRAVGEAGAAPRSCSVFAATRQRRQQAAARRRGSAAARQRGKGGGPRHAPAPAISPSQGPRAAGAPRERRDAPPARRATGARGRPRARARGRDRAQEGLRCRFAPPPRASPRLPHARFFAPRASFAPRAAYRCGTARGTRATVKHGDR